MKTLIILLLWTSLAHAAQSIVIPEGTSEYGPVSVTTLHRYAGVEVERTSAAFTRGTFQLFHSTDGGKTFAATPFHTFVHLGGGSVPQTFESNHDKPAGTTHIKVVAVLEGGSMNLAQAPNLRSK